MYYLVGVGHNGLAAHITESDWEGFFRKCCMSSARIRWMICCEMAVKRMGVLGVSERKMKALTVKMVTVTLIGKGRQNLTCFVH
jgi:hypothetical protein